MNYHPLWHDTADSRIFPSMIALIQRVSQAEVRVRTEVIGAMTAACSPLSVCNGRIPSPTPIVCWNGC